MGYPSKKLIKDALAELESLDGSFVLPRTASNVDKIKYELCEMFVKYIQEKHISQAELARLLNVDRSRVNWIVKYRIEHFTIDRLYELVSIIDNSIILKVS